MHWKTFATALRHSENNAKLFVHFLLRLNALQLVSSGTVLQADELLLLTEHGRVPIHHPIEFHDASGSSDWDHYDQVDFVVKHSLKWSFSYRAINVLNYHMFILNDCWNRFLLVHLGEADVTNTENVLVNGWNRRLTLFNQWVLVRHLAILVHENLAGPLVDALCELIFQIHLRTKE